MLVCGKQKPETWCDLAQVPVCDASDGCLVAKFVTGVTELITTLCADASGSIAWMNLGN